MLKEQKVTLNIWYSQVQRVTATDSLSEKKIEQITDAPKGESKNSKIKLYSVVTTGDIIWKS